MGRIWDWNILFWEIMERSLFEARLIFDDVLKKETLVESVTEETVKVNPVRELFEEEYAVWEKSYGGLLPEGLWELSGKGMVLESLGWREELSGVPSSRVDYNIGQREESFYQKAKRIARETGYDVFESLGIADAEMPLMEWYNTVFEGAIARTVTESFFDKGDTQERFSVTGEISERIFDGVIGEWNADAGVQEKALGREKVRRILEGGYDRKEQGENNVKIEFVNTSNMHDEFDLEKAMDMMSQRLCDMMSRSAEGFYL